MYKGTEEDLNAIKANCPFILRQLKENGLYEGMKTSWSGIDSFNEVIMRKFNLINNALDSALIGSILYQSTKRSNMVDKEYLMRHILEHILLSNTYAYTLDNKNVYGEIINKTLQRICI